MVVMFVLLSVPGSSLAQEVGGTAPGSSLQSGGGGLQQAPAGLQGSTQQIFNSTATNTLNQNQSNQQLLDGLALSATIDPKKETLPAAESKKENSSARLFAGLCLVLAAIAAALWAWLRRFQSNY